MNKLVETAKEIDRILKDGIEIHPHSPIHVKLQQALQLVCHCCGNIYPHLYENGMCSCDECGHEWQSN